MTRTLTGVLGLRPMASLGDEQTLAGAVKAVWQAVDGRTDDDQH